MPKKRSPPRLSQPEVLVVDVLSFSRDFLRRQAGRIPESNIN